MDMSYGDITVWVSPLMAFGMVCVWGLVRSIQAATQ